MAAIHVLFCLCVGCCGAAGQTAGPQSAGGSAERYRRAGVFSIGLPGEGFKWYAASARPCGVLTYGAFRCQRPGSDGRQAIFLSVSRRRASDGGAASASRHFESALDDWIALGLQTRQVTQPRPDQNNAMRFDGSVAGLVPGGEWFEARLVTIVGQRRVYHFKIVADDTQTAARLAAVVDTLVEER